MTTDYIHAAHLGSDGRMRPYRARGSDRLSRSLPILNALVPDRAADILAGKQPA